jgi:hypothetical protein
MTSRIRRRRNDQTDLMSRSSGGIDVTLFWNRRTSQLTVELADRAHGTVSAFPVAPERARYAFDHPYAYMAEERWGRLAA